MVSIGGWSNSVDDLAFDKVTATPEDMDKFTTEAVEFMQKYGFDGIDIDWEYPDNDDRKTKFVALIKQLREKLTAAGKEDDIYYQLSIAVTADHKKMQYIDPKVVKDYVDNVNVMTSTVALIHKQVITQDCTLTMRTRIKSLICHQLWLNMLKSMKCQRTS